MPEMEQQEFKFPDESEAVEDTSNEISIEIEDDTPPEDRGRDPMPKPLVEELEKDDLEKYDGEVKARLKQMRKVWHDERRAKEEAFREQQEAIRIAQKLLEENKRIKSVLDTGGKEYAAVLQNAAALEMEQAKRAYKDAYDNGDSDKLVEAQQAMQVANFRLMQAQNFKMPPLQEEDYPVQQPNPVYEQPKPQQHDSRLLAWQERNPWYGPDDEMTAAALGVHEKLRKGGEVAIGSDEYYAILDKTIRKRFPEYFHTEEPESTAKTEAPRTRAGTVVAPAIRSTASNKIRLRTSQIALAKKLGLTPEQYAIELKKLEAQNG